MPGVIGLHALGVPGTAVGAGVGWGLDRAGRYPVPRRLAAPSRPTLAALGPLVAAALALAPPLFDGALGVGPAAWFALAVPYVPTLVGTATLLVLSDAVAAPSPATTAGAAVAFAGLAGLQVAWWYLLAAGAGRAGRHLLAATADRT